MGGKELSSCFIPTSTRSFASGELPTGATAACVRPSFAASRFHRHRFAPSLGPPAWPACLPPRPAGQGHQSLSLSLTLH